MPDTFLENFQQSVVSARSLSAIFRVFPALQTQIVLHLSEPGQMLELQKQRVFCRKFDLPHLPFANSVFCFADCSSLNSNCSPRAQHFTFSCSRISQIGENIPRLSASIFVASLGDLVFIIVVGAVTSSSTRRCWCRWSSTRPPTWCYLIDYNRRLLFRKNVYSRNFQQKSGKSSGRKGSRRVRNISSIEKSRCFEWKNNNFVCLQNRTNIPLQELVVKDNIFLF